MRVRISYVVEVDDEFRRQINKHYGEEGLADRGEVKCWFRMYGESMNDELAFADQQRAMYSGQEHARSTFEWLNS